MHFFNPAPVMRLLEVVAGEQLAATPRWRVARATGEAMGKHVIDAADGPGFLVNRCNRPFGARGAAARARSGSPTPEQVDRICRLAGGFRMGPFELMDLVGDRRRLRRSPSPSTSSRYGEPRWRPSPLAARMVAAGRHGRKSGRGWYDYRRRPDRPTTRRRPSPAAATGGSS